MNIYHHLKVTIQNITILAHQSKVQTAPCSTAQLLGNCQTIKLSGSGNMFNYVWEETSCSLDNIMPERPWNLLDGEREREREREGEWMRGWEREDADYGRAEPTQENIHILQSFLILCSWHIQKQICSNARLTIVPPVYVGLIRVRTYRFQVSTIGKVCRVRGIPVYIVLGNVANLVW